MTTRPIFLTNHAIQRSEQRHITKEALRAATLWGDRFVQEDGTILQLVTRRAAERIVQDIGLSSGYVDAHLRGIYVVIKRSGAVLTAGRRYSGAAGRIRRS